MVSIVSGTPRRLHPLHAALLAFPLPLFVGGLLSDLAYWSSFHVQWINFSSWLIAGGLLRRRLCSALGGWSSCFAGRPRAGGR